MVCERHPKEPRNFRATLCHYTKLRAYSILGELRRRAGDDQFLDSIPAREEPAPDALSGLVRDAVNRLPEKYRKVIELAYFMGWTAEEIGAVLNIPPNTVNQQLRRARERLREILEPRMGRAVPAVATTA
jgi:RNA polymerase sigma-70 factor (ECF subfamily)